MAKKYADDSKLASFKKLQLDKAAADLETSIKTLKSNLYLYIMWGGHNFKKKNKELLNSLKSILKMLADLE